MSKEKNIEPSPEEMREILKQLRRALIGAKASAIALLESENVSQQQLREIEVGAPYHPRSERS